ncbi:VIR protein [Plasmodium vivax]|uniref:VIR protein n=1 Tax=Plasmodium vivax TaxID=5855 RepID=A0A1G4EC19_PLAVI|nr:VIR protein [Plasmodium vivax]
MSDIDEDKQIPKKFYSRLDAAEDPSKWQDLTTYRALRSSIGNEEEKNILDKLARNIKIIITEYSGNTKKRCRDVNHWINEKIKTLEGKKLGSDVRPYSYSVFNDVKWNGINSEKVCDRDDKLYSSLNAELMKELDDYCEIRDNNGCNVLKNKNECLKFNSYIKRKKEYFSGQITNNCNPPDCKLEDYKIDENCSLYNTDITFPEINCDVLYKKEFTPVGSIIHRFKRRKYDLKRNIEKVDDDRYSSYHSETIPANSSNERYYIEYARPHN